MRLNLIVLFISLVWTAGIHAADAHRIVDAQIERVWRTRQASASLDELGRLTMREAMRILALDEEAVEPLAVHLRWEEDWMIRFWIADLLGYIRSAQAVKVLGETVRDPAGTIEVRMRAVESIARQKSTHALTLLRGLHADITDRRIVRLIQKHITQLEKISGSK